jgi:RecJ-like exonuclease
MAERENPDTVPSDQPGTGENICRRCRGAGKVQGKSCPDCNGTGKVITGVGGG